MNTSACRKTRSLQWQRNRFESRKNLTLEQGGSTRSMRCFIEHHPRFYQIYTAQVTKMKGIRLGLQPERRAIIHGVIESFAQYANGGRYP